MKKRIYSQKIKCSNHLIKGGFYLYKNHTSFLEEQLRLIEEKRIIANRPIINKIGKLWTFE